MGRKALALHINGAGLINKRPGVHQIKTFFYNAGTSSSGVSGESSGRVASCESSGACPLIGLVSKSQTTTAEILRVLHTPKHN